MTTQSMEALLKAGETEQARTLADTRLRKDPEDRAALLTLAKLATLEGAWQRAEDLVRRATRGGKENDADSLLVQAALAAQRNEVDLARSLYEQVTRTTPPRAEAFFGLGYLLASQENVAGAHAAFTRAVELDPEVAPYRFHLARMCFIQEDLKGALPHLEKALELNPLYPPVYVAWTTVLQELGELDKAEHLLRQGIKLMPEEPELLNLLGSVLSMRGNTAEALTIAEKLAKAHPDEPALQGNLARLLMVSERTAEALELCRKQAARGRATSQTRFIEGMVLECQDPPDMDGAVVAYREAMKLDSSDWAAANNLGSLLMRRETNDQGEGVTQAIEALEEARRREPGRVEPALNLALAYARKGEKDHARSLAQQILAGSEHPSAREQAERLLKTLG